MKFGIDSYRRDRYLRRFVARLLLCVFAIHATVPLGYMPAALSSGSAVQLCPEGLGESWQALFANEHQHHNHGEHVSSGSGDSFAVIESKDSGWSADCPFGVSLSASFAVASDESSVEYIFRQQSSPQFAVVYRNSFFLKSLRARAPPAFHGARRIT